MSINARHGLPFLPGNSFRDMTKSAFHRTQTLAYNNGFALPRPPTHGIGQDPLKSEELAYNYTNELSSETLALLTEPSSRAPVVPFIPAHVALDKKVLRFHGYFQQRVLHSPDEEYRVRPVVLFYYLEDDSMCVMEPLVENSGLPQGKLIKRQQLPRKDRSVPYHWKDLNLALDLEVYGVLYRITNCDSFTREFLESEGILVNDPEPMPVDPYTSHRAPPQRSYVSPSNFDHQKQFLTMDRKVLRFFALWDDKDTIYKETRPVNIQYYLVDDTVEIREVHQANSGRDPFPVLMRRQRLPKTIREDSEPFPRCVLEVSPQEVQEYYSPRDFRVGETMRLMGRTLRLYDCDSFTRSYFQSNHPEVETKRVELPRAEEVAWDTEREVPPYNGFGSLEDSLQNCLHLIPQPPKKDLIKMLENDHKVLRYIARLDSNNPHDEGRHFILSYFLASNMISIFEKPTRNSGIMAGKFLEKTRVPKPGFEADKPLFYSPADLAIGATVVVFGHRFVLTDADHYVLKYLESEADQIPSQTLESLRNRLGVHPDQGTGTNPTEEQYGGDQGVVEPSSQGQEPAA
ncbi:EF-hand domain-containing protein 1 isoform X1 [Gadus morhua]|uniref:EF-hand domain-containing protein 1 isoform X1 n=1 Tax=Gadus morhua TaxID=8049 RepID=UPI0011B85954|nr:EF-hand domain-containing protein 1 isoform X1 [Gadus morhua]